MGVSALSQGRSGRIGVSGDRGIRQSNFHVSGSAPRTAIALWSSATARWHAAVLAARPRLPGVHSFSFHNYDYRAVAWLRMPAPSPNRPSSGAGGQASAIRKGEVHLFARRARGDFQRFIGNIEGKCFILPIQCDVGHSVRCHGYMSVVWVGFDRPCVGSVVPLGNSRVCSSRELAGGSNLWRMPWRAAEPPAVSRPNTGLADPENRKIVPAVTSCLGPPE